MLFLSEQEMWQSVTLEDVMDAIEDAYAIHKSGNYKMPDRFIAQRDKNMMLYMPCFLDSVIGTKMLSEFPDNSSLGIPYLNGLMILNNAKTGLPKAIMNGSVLTAMRTGAVGGVALRYLAPEDAASVGLVGCGMQGLHQLLYACEVRPITDIYLYDAYAKDLSGFIERLSARLASFGKNDIQIHTCADTRELAEHSRVLISATQAVDPVYPDDEMLCCHRLLASGTARTAGCGVETRQERVHRASVCLRGERRSENSAGKGRSDTEARPLYRGSDRRYQAGTSA